MEPADWDRLQASFLAALDLPSEEGSAFLSHSLADDLDLSELAIRMLSAHRREAPLRIADLQQIVAEVFGSSSQIDASLTIGPYRLQRCLGEGGMGVVWLAQRTDAGNEVAIKFLLHATLSPLRRERFSREIRNLAKLNHPYIARMYDAGSLADGIPWFTMEYVKGTNPTSYCCQPGRTAAEIIQLFHRVCEAVQHAHQQLVVHRDLKPSNILVLDDGRPKLLDFGISRELQQRDEFEEVQTTAPNLRFMSRFYAAPEWMEYGIVAASNDVYSLGVLLYEMLTSGPFSQAGSEGANESRARPSSIVADRNKMAGTTKTPMSGLTKSAWNDLDLLCLKAICKDPAQRYPTVEALIRDLDHYTQSEPLEARGESPIYKVEKFLHRNRTPVLAAGIAIAMTVVMVAIFTWRLAGERNKALIQAQRAQRIQQFLLNLFEGDDKEAGPGRDLRVVTLLDRGAPVVQTLNGEPAVQADLYHTLGTMYMKLGKLDRADAMLQSALDLERSNRVSDAAALAEVLTAQGLLRSEQGRSAEAEQLVRQAIALTDRLSPHQVLVQEQELTALGEVQLSRGQYAPAVDVLKQAVALESPAGAAVDLSETLSELGTANLYLGQYADASVIFHRVLGLDEGNYADNHPRLADDLQNISQVEEMWGKYQDAERDERRALRIDRAWYGDENPRTAVMETTLASTLIFLNNYVEAEILLGKALHTQEVVYGETSPHVAFVLNSLAGVETRKRHFQAAEADYERMAAIYRSAYGVDDYRVSVAQSNLAGVLFNEKRYVESEGLFERVIQTYIRTLPADNLNLGIAQIKLGRVFMAEHRFEDAVPHTLAGYAIVSKQQSPSSGFVEGARHDLFVIYQKMGQPVKAKLYRRE